MDNRRTAMAAGWIPKKRNRLQGVPPQWADIRGVLHMRMKDAAAQLNVPITYLRRLCRKNGHSQWPGKRIRYLRGIGRMQEVGAPKGSPLAGIAGPSQLAMVAAETKEKEKEEPVANPPPRKALTTLNLIDKVGLSSSGSDRT